jgi:hypothetical protein
MHRRTSARWRLVVAGCLMLGLPAAAYVAAPAQAGSVTTASAPAIDLAGFNTSATSAGAQIELLLPGVVPLGDPTKGNFIQASLPYSSSAASTGPTTGTTASPLWPGDAIATAGNALQTFAPTLPAALVKALDEPVLARSTYPAQVGDGTTGSFTPTGPLGIGGSTTTSSASQTSGKSAITDLSPLGASKGVPLIDIASATSTSSSSVAAGAVADSAETRIGQITIAGVITIDGIDTTAAASSDGKTGKPVVTTNLGSVKVAGLAASIGPDGITLNGKPGQVGSALLVKTANKLLKTLQKIGLSVTALAPKTHVHGANASATSGAVLIKFEDDNLPDLSKLAPQLPIPLPNSFGVDVSLGLSQATAAATRLPPEQSLGTPVSSTGPPVATGVGGGSGVAPPNLGGGLPPVDDGSSSPAVSPPVVATQQTATVFGAPVRTAWVVISLLIAVLAAGPLLTYANWQLLRGRTP